MLTQEQKRQIELEILRYRAIYDYRDSFTWTDDTVMFHGSLYIYGNANLPQLTSIGGALCIYSNATFEAPQLTSIFGYLDIRSNVTLNAPQLTSIGGFINISGNATLNVPKLVNRNFVEDMK